MQYEKGEVVALSASAYSGYTFEGWESNGEIISTQPTHFEVTMDANKTITAKFTALLFGIEKGTVVYDETSISHDGYDYLHVPSTTIITLVFDNYGRRYRRSTEMAHGYPNTYIHDAIAKKSYEVSHYSQTYVERDYTDFFDITGSRYLYLGDDGWQSNAAYTQLENKTIAGKECTVFFRDDGTAYDNVKVTNEYAGWNRILFLWHNIHVGTRGFTKLEVIDFSEEIEDPENIFLPPPGYEKVTSF